MKPNRLLNCIVLAIALACLVRPVEAATYYVSTTGSDATGDGSVGNPWATIDHADSQFLLSAGDTVVVQAGTYTMTNSAGVALQNTDGTSGAPVTYQANGKVVIDASGVVGESYGIQVQSAYTIVSGFEIKGAAHGISVDASQVWAGNNCTITNNIIHDSAPQNSSGIYLKSCSDALVVRNVIYNISAGSDAPWGTLGAGIRMQAGGTNKVWNNTIDNNINTIIRDIYYYNFII